MSLQLTCKQAIGIQTIDLNLSISQEASLPQKGEPSMTWSTLESLQT